MSKRRTPEQREAAAAAALMRARRDGLQAKLDGLAAMADARGCATAVGRAIRNLLGVCDLFEWDIERATQLTDAVAVQFSTRKVPPLADIVERAEAAAQAMEAGA